MVRMITKQEHQYAGRRLYAGDEYECEERHVPVMLKLGWSHPLDVKTEESKKRRYIRRDLEAQN